MSRSKPNANQPDYSADVEDILMEFPQPFSVGETMLYIYPITLGKSIWFARLAKQLNISESLLRLSPYAEAHRLSLVNPEAVCRIIAAHTMATREELFNAELLNERCKLLRDNLSAEEIAELFSLCLISPDLKVISKHLGIEAEQKRRQKVMKAKKNDRNSYTFGGRSIFGSLITPACEKLNLTPRQVVWEISLNQLQLLMADCITSVYLTDEERKRCRVSNDNERINADDPANFDRIAAMSWK